MQRQPSQKAELIGAMGLHHTRELRPWHAMKRTGLAEVRIAVATPSQSPAKAPRSKAHWPKRCRAG